MKSAGSGCRRRRGCRSGASVHAHAVAAQSEEGSVAEREDAAEAPDEVDREPPARRSRDTLPTSCVPGRT